MATPMRWDTTKPGHITVETVGQAILLSRAVHGRMPVALLVSPRELDRARQALDEFRRLREQAGTPIPPMPVEPGRSVLQGEIWLELQQEAT